MGCHAKNLVSCYVCAHNVMYMSYVVFVQRFVSCDMLAHVSSYVHPSFYIDAVLMFVAQATVVVGAFSATTCPALQGSASKGSCAMFISLCVCLRLCAYACVSVWC